jgi:hypothetical protein
MFVETLMLIEVAIYLKSKAFCKDMTLHVWDMGLAVLGLVYASSTVNNGPVRVPQG